MSGHLYDFLKAEFPKKLPDNFADRMDPIALARAIEQLEEPFVFNVPEEASIEFLMALGRVKAVLPPERWLRVLHRLAPRAGTSVLGGDPWGYRVLPNGGLAIRNYHRVVAIDFLTRTRSVFSGLHPEEIAFELETVLSRARDQDDAALLHHGPKGLVITRRLPRQFQPNGQTILFVFERKLLKGLRVLGQPCVVQKKSRGAVLAVRVYRDTLCAYPMYRHTDAADVLLCDYTISRMEEPDEPDQIRESLLDNNNLQAAIGPLVREQITDMGVEFFGLPPALVEDLLDIMTSDEPHSWKTWITEQLNLFPPVFAKDHRDVPPILDTPEAVAAAKHMRADGQTRAYLFSAGLIRNRQAVKAMLRSKGLAGEFMDDTPVAGLGIRMRNALHGRALAREFSKTIGEVQLVVPHLALHQRYRGGKSQPGGNACWFGWSEVPNC
jgi:hypothetical protein